MNIKIPLHKISPAIPSQLKLTVQHLYSAGSRDISTVTKISPLALLGRNDRFHQPITPTPVQVDGYVKQYKSDKGSPSFLLWT